MRILGETDQVDMGDINWSNKEQNFIHTNKIWMSYKQKDDKRQTELTEFGFSMP